MKGQIHPDAKYCSFTVLSGELSDKQLSDVPQSGQNLCTASPLGGSRRYGGKAHSRIGKFSVYRVLRAQTARDARLPRAIVPVGRIYPTFSTI